MFQRKTDGNLSSQETQMLRAVISELQMQFTKAPQLRRQRMDQNAQNEMVKETFSQPAAGPVEDLSNPSPGEEE